ncbi:MAG: hypothetical protein HYT10_00050 [Candidatus Levybacteria bacterium]|nr:hypothetical protein [Candidatus Levybacteria bacterium]
MAKKGTKHQRHTHGYKHYLIPSFIGLVIAWYFSNSMNLALVVFVAVWIGNWASEEILQK